MNFKIQINYHINIYYVYMEINQNSNKYNIIKLEVKCYIA
jgi:hypothetical protein